MIQLLIHMKEDNVNKQLKYLEKRNKKVDEHVRTVSNPERRSSPFPEDGKHLEVQLKYATSILMQSHQLYLESNAIVILIALTKL